MQRWLKFTKYLPEFGWNPIVLTVDPERATYPQRDESLNKEVPSDLEVIRTSSFEVLQMYAKVAGKERVPYGGFSNEKSTAAWSRFLRGNFFIPDARKGWNKYAVTKALELIRSRQIDCIVTTGPPHSTHLIGLEIKKELKELRWGADFRDPWTDIYYNREMLRTPWAKKLDSWYEKTVLKSADFCMTASHGFAELFSKKVNRHFHVITNGFDTAPASNRELRSKDKLVISYTGTMAESYEPEVFLKSLVGLERDFELRIAGSFSAGIQRRIDELGLSDKVTFQGYIEHDKAVEEMHQADVLLLITPQVDNSKGIIPGKLFEYLNTGNPILAITEDLDGDVARILEETKAGRVFKRDDEEGIKNFILSGISKMTFDEGAIRKYHRRALSERLVGILNKAKES